MPFWKGSEMIDEKKLLEWLQPVQDPELRMSLVDLGLIYKIEKSAEKDEVVVEMTLTSPTCPAASYIVEQVKNRLLEHPEVEKADVSLVFEPRWDPRTMASEDAKEAMGVW